jgi:hypothetical protein
MLDMPSVLVRNHQRGFVVATRLLIPRVQALLKAAGDFVMSRTV